MLGSIKIMQKYTQFPETFCSLRYKSANIIRIRFTSVGLVLMIPFDLGQSFFKRNFMISQRIHTNLFQILLSFNRVQAKQSLIHTYDFSKALICFKYFNKVSLKILYIFI